MKRCLLSRFNKWASHEYSEGQRIFALFGLRLLFPVAIPLFIIFIPRLIDKYFHLPNFYGGMPNILVGIVLIILGLVFGLWSIYVQFTIGRGTPAPMMPTQKLVILRPYSYCRNPMSFGAILLYLGIAVCVGSLSAVGLVVLFAIFLIAYIKLIEERELQERYGSKYSEYKRTTPFLLPRLWKRS
jgi:protein-S-isoprenylcysteine O-methyltransferase Ste14